MKPRVIKLNINPNIVNEGKNTNGINGEKCDKCGGYGFTIGIKGGKLNCEACENTGVRLPTIRELLARIIALEEDNRNLRKAILKDLGFQGKKVPTNIKEPHV